MLVDSISRIVTGGLFSQNDLLDYNIADSVDRLYRAKLIRKNNPREFLNYFNIDDLKSILKKNLISTRGLSQKSSLVDEVEKNISDEEIITHKKYKSYYVVTEEGKKVIEKYNSVIWFHENQEMIFGWQGGNNRFNTEYFYKNYDKSPINLLIEYYSDRSAEITGKLYFLEEKYDTAISYATDVHTINLNEVIIESVQNYYWRNRERPDYFIRGRNREFHWINFVYKQIFDQEKLIDSSIEKSYKNIFEYKDLVTKELFTNIIQALLQNDEYDLKKYGLELIARIDEKYPDEPDHYEEEKTYHESMLKDVALLDLLIAHLDLELLEQLKERIELKIEEWKRL